MNDQIQNQTVRDIVELFKEGSSTSESYVRDCTSKIEQTDAQLHAWQYLDAEKAIGEAKSRDDYRRAGKPTGPLLGIPIGVKDIFDTADMPTDYGSEAYSGNQPAQHSAVVEKLHEAGAVVMGKTVTTEFAFMHPAVTCNPHNPQHTPGGSSSGSAAAVAAGHVPLAIGSQTNGSTIRPASFCGIYGFKPSSGIISRRGALETSATLDQVGLFARDLGDIALLADSLAGFDHSSSYLNPKPPMLTGYLSEAPMEPNFAYIDMPYADQYSVSVSEGMEELLKVPGIKVDRLPAPQSFSVLISAHRIIHEYEIYRALEEQRLAFPDKLSDTIKGKFESAALHTTEQYEEALDIQQGTIDWFNQFFLEFDAVITPSALGEAPLVGDSTGDPICCTVWTFSGLPCLSLPLLQGENNLPIGVQLVGSLREDDRLLRTARWLLTHLNQQV